MNPTHFLCRLNCGQHCVNYRFNCQRYVTIQNLTYVSEMLQTEVSYLQPNIDKHTVDTVDIHDWKLAQGSNNAPMLQLGH